MKKAVLLIISLLFLFVAQSQKVDCSKVKNGIFKSALDIDGKKIVTMIRREGEKQVEENEAMGVKMEFVVKWTSDCTYELSKPKIIKGSFPSASDDQLLVVKILDVKKDSYSAEVSSNFFEGNTVFDFLIIK